MRLGLFERKREKPVVVAHCSLKIHKKEYSQKLETVRWIIQHGKTILLEPKKGKYYRLNETASFIWDYCDGTRSAKEIAQILQKKFHIKNSTNIEKDVIKAIFDFSRKGFLR